MPSPVKNPAIRYYDNFNLNQSGKPYSHLDFDWEDTLANFCSSDFSGVLSDQSGNTQYWYDRYGRIIASQNPVQKDNELYAYTLYDDQGRPDEVGLVRPDYALTESIAKADDFGLNVKLWVESGLRIEVVKTIYDEYLSVSINNKFENGQQNLRLRVASILYFDNFSIYTDIANEYTTATHYSYDTHGNVIETLQDVPLMKPVEQDIKSTQYKYDLISGNMNKVEYQKGEIDGFTHMYYYDELNRLKEVQTSTDNQVHISTDAKYQYYDYGPLARVETGEYQVQGTDYAYTINGWLKGANSNTLDPNRDMGKDGTKGYYANNLDVHRHFAKDAFGFTLNYFEGDYRAIGTNNFEAHYSNTPFGNASANLYNGNIRHMVTAIEGMEIQGYAYTYDQLQRLNTMKVFRSEYLIEDNDWKGAKLTDDYFTRINYDKNGNILTLQRNGYKGAQLEMDRFEYFYETIGGNPSNRLNGVKDSAPNYAGYDDIKDGSAYKYNRLGELVYDNTEAMKLEWRYGDHKLKNIERLDQNSPNVEFIYNPLGVRVAKIIKPRSGGVVLEGEKWKVTYYSYDANGQLMATYNSDLYNGTIKETKLEEQYIYGSKRVGVIKANKVLYDEGPVQASISPIKDNFLGKKRYELTNHLGNVLATITDRKTYNPNDGYYEPVITMKADYYAFGMLMPGRNEGLGDQRHLFNGMEADEEVSGEGNSYTTQFRQYDPRLGRWKSLDPLMTKYPSMSPYVAFNNNPIYFTDPLGLEGDEQKDGDTRVHNGRNEVFVGGSWGYDATGGEDMGKTANAKFSMIQMIASMSNMISSLENSDKQGMIFSAGDVLYQMNLFRRELSEENPISSYVITESVNIALIPSSELADSYVDDPQNAGWYDLMLMFIFELQEDVEIDNPNSPAIKDLSKHKGVLDAKSLAIEDSKNLKIGESKSGSTSFGYHLHNMNENINEMKTLDPRNVNSLELFLGSYTVNYTVKKISDTEILFQWQVVNVSGLESATRFRRSKNGVNQGIMNNKERGSGIHIGGTFKQVFKSSEIIKL